MLCRVVDIMGVDFLEGERVLAFDLETTGISTSRDRIVQLALIGSNQEGEALQVELLIHPQRPIPPDSSRIHGIFDEDVKNANSFSHHADEIHNLIEGAVIV